MVRSKTATRTLKYYMMALSMWNGVDDTIICPKLMQKASATVA